MFSRHLPSDHDASLKRACAQQPLVDNGQKVEDRNSFRIWNQWCYRFYHKASLIFFPISAILAFIENILIGKMFLSNLAFYLYFCQSPKFCIVSPINKYTTNKKKKKPRKKNERLIFQTYDIRIIFYLQELYVVKTKIICCCFFFYQIQLHWNALIKNKIVTSFKRKIFEYIKICKYI